MCEKGAEDWTGRRPTARMPLRKLAEQVHDRGQQECVLMTDGEWEYFWSQHDARHDARQHDARQHDANGNQHDARQNANLNQHPPESDDPASSDEQGDREEEEPECHQPQPHKVTQTNYAAIARKAQRANRCGSCTACRSSDCGVCKNCLDKPRRATARLPGHARVERTIRRVAGSGLLMPGPDAPPPRPPAPQVRWTWHKEKGLPLADLFAGETTAR